MFKKLFKTLASVATAALLASSVVVLGAAPAYAAVEPSPGDLSSARATILADTNAARATEGLPPLVINATLNNLAQICSQKQAVYLTMAHCNPWDQYPAGYSWAGENVAYNYTPSSVVDAWLASPGHRASIMKNTGTDIGIGYYFDDDGHAYFTQNFGAYASTKTVPSAVSFTNATTAGLGELSLTFAAPVFNGNSTITNYTIQLTSVADSSVITKTVTSAGTTVITGIPGGVAYNIKIRANNAQGAGLWSDTIQATAVNVPTVTSVTAAPGSRDVSISWTINNGGSALTSIAVVLTGEGTLTLDPSETSTTFANLTPGASYSGSVTATNSLGQSVSSPFTFTTDAVAPDAPINVTGSLATSTSLVVNWDSGVFDGGATVTGYTVTADNGSGSIITTNFGSTARQGVLYNLIRGTTYTYTVSATNSVGSTPSASGTINAPIIAPTAPTGVTAELTDEQKITVTWVTPTDDGGSALNAYTIAVYENSVHTTDISVSPSVNSTVLDSATINANKTYSFNIIATNNNSFNSIPSTSSNNVVVPATPTAPSVVTNITADNFTTSGFNVYWNEPVSNGGTAITGYKVELKKGATLIESHDLSNVTFDYSFSGLDRATVYTVTIVAVNNRGNSPEDPQLLATSAEAPTAPQNLAFDHFNNNGEVVFTWGVPSDNGGETATYEYELSETGVGIISSNTTSITSYTSPPSYMDSEFTLKVRATNSSGLYSSWVNVTVPTAKSANAPTITSVTESSNNLNIAWEAPTNMGDLDYNGFSLVIEDSTNTPVYSSIIDAIDAQDPTGIFTISKSAATPALAKGETYTIKLSALTGSASAEGATASATHVMDTTVPSAARNLEVTLDDSGINFVATWDAVTDNGGTGTGTFDYRASLYVGSNTSGALVGTNHGSTMLTTNFNGLDPNTQYTLAVTTSNILGDGPTVTSTFTTTPTFPDAPINLNVSASSNPDNVNFSWDAPLDDGGAPITSYRVKAYVGGVLFATYNVSGTSKNDSTGFAPNVAVTFTVEAMNYKGYSAESSISSVYTTPVRIASAPTGVQVNVDELDTNVSWNASVNTGGSTNVTYMVVVTDSLTNNQTYPAGSATSLTINGLNMLDDYSIEVIAVNEAGSSAFSSPAVNFTAGLSTPRPVTNLNASENGSDPQKVDITWDEASSLPTYMRNGIEYNVKVYDRLDNSLISNTTTNSLNVTTSALPKGTLIRVEVTAVFETLVSSAQVVNFAVDVTASSNVQNLNTTTGTGSITATWTTPADDGGTPITGYNIAIYSGVTLVSSKVVTGLTGGFTGLEPNVTYTVTVSAVNGAGTSPEESIFASTPIVKPSAPVSIQLSGKDVTWGAPVNNGGDTVTYEVELSAANAPSTVLFSDTISATTFNLDTAGVTFAHGASYILNVTAKNSAGSSTIATVTYKEPAIHADAPIDTILSVKSVNSMEANWTAPSYNGGATITEYIVTYTDITNNVVKTVSVTSGTSVLLTALTRDAEYEFTVTAVNEAGHGDSSASSNSHRTAPADFIEADVLTEAQVQTLIENQTLNAFTITREGNLIKIAAPSGEEWVFGVAYSSPTMLGWAYAGSGGILSFSVAGMPAGDHTFILYDKSGTPMGYAKFNIAAAATGGTGAGGLARTGAEVPSLLIYGTLGGITLGILLLLADLNRRNRKQVKVFKAKA